jgi:flagellar L-ring protein FlgH
MIPAFRHIILSISLLLVLLAPAPVAQAQTSMFADPKARAPGDLLTILLAERTAAERQSSWDDKSNAALGTGATISGDGLSGRFAADAFFNKEARNRNQSLQRDLITGTMTARIVGLDPGGNLVIEGERRTSVNGEAHILKVAGVVRPLDVQANNTILSHQIANATIEYRRSGIQHRFFRPALLARAGLVAVLGAAVFFATQ